MNTIERTYNMYPLKKSTDMHALPITITISGEV